MRSIVAPTPSPHVGELSAHPTSAHEYIASRHSASTRRAYGQDLIDFNLWGMASGLDTLPASVDAVVLYVAMLADKGLKPSTISRKVSAIRFSHAQAGLSSPTAAEPVRAVLAGIKRVKGSKPRQVAPATIEVVEQMLAVCEVSPRGIRDRALIAIGFGAALRRSELAAMQVEDVSIDPKGLTILVRRSKTDPEGRGQTVAVLNGSRLGVTRLLENWLEQSGRQSGPLFGLTDRKIANVIKGRASLAGLDANEFSGHSLRAGFITTAAQAGADIFRLMDVTRHRSVNTVRGYVRQAKQFDDHAGASFM